MAEQHKCPECGADIQDVRVTCPSCGYDYKPDDYEDPSAGNEFSAGKMVDDEGNELLDESANQ
jgi:rubredoxin